MQHFENYYNLCNGQDWQLETRLADLSKNEIDKLNELKRSLIEPELLNIELNTMFEDSCMHLQRLYKLIANRYAKSHTEKLEYLTKVYEVCKSSSIHRLEGQASYLLGNAYETDNNLETALSCYKNFYEISKRDNDRENFGKASEALAKCYQKLGQINKSIEYLEKYLNDMSHREDNQHQYCRACSCLASIYNTLVIFLCVVTFFCFLA
jgi:tetratricopeptide (TPR) repeat protein